MNNLKKKLIRKVKPLLPHSVWVYLRYLKRKIFNNGYYALNNLDRKLEKYLDYRNGFFIELGANDGLTQSNTLSLEEKKNWRGLLIEPIPHQFLSCCHYRSKVGNKIFCNACVPFDFKEKYVDIEYANLMSVSSNLDHDLNDTQNFLKIGRDHLDNNAKNITFGASPATLTHLLEVADAPKFIDLLSLDVEGAELSVLKGINFKKYNFKYLLIESRKIERIIEFLSPHDYEVIEKLSYHDYLFRYNGV